MTIATSTSTDIRARHRLVDRRNDTAAQTRRLVAQLQRLGHTVTLQPAA